MPKIHYGNSMVVDVVERDDVQENGGISELSGLDLTLIAGGGEYPVCQHPHTTICETDSSGVTRCTICR